MLTASLTTIQYLGLLLAVSLFIDLIGFYRTVWFISIGYSASIVAFVFVTVAFAGTNLDPILGLQLLGALIWGGSPWTLSCSEREKAVISGFCERSDRQVDRSSYFRQDLHLVINVASLCVHVFSRGLSGQI
jgi:hypothetical protein